MSSMIDGASSRGRLKKKAPTSPDEDYYSKHNNHAIPRTVVRQIILQLLPKIKGKTPRLEKKAIDILHCEIEKYIVEIFTVSGCMMDVSKRNTAHPLLFKKAAKLYGAVLSGITPGGFAGGPT
jgi:histone H3/H4